MTHGLDTGFLVAAEVAGHGEHVASRSRLAALRGAGDDFALAPQVLAEFVHVVTDPKRFSAPLIIEHAITRAEFWWTSPGIIQVVPNMAAMAEFFTWMKSYQLGRKRILDTLLAATYKAAGIGSLLTTDAGDFAIFDYFEILEPEVDTTSAEASD